MGSRIFYSIVFLLAISMGTVFADTAIITVQTDNDNYEEGDTIVISGQVSTKIGDTPITLQLLNEGNLVYINQITVAQDRNYLQTVVAGGPLWNLKGEYIARVLYGEGNIAEAVFNYIPESEAVLETKVFEVSTESDGTFDVEYSIKGGIVQEIKLIPYNFSLEVQMDTTDDGFITLDMPREFITAEDQNGKDVEFIILIDGINVEPLESAIFSKSRVITINFEQGDSKIEIIGTHVIPEFGTIVMMILIVGIMTTIFITRNKFQIKI